MSRQQTEELLADLLGRLRAALLNEPFSADPARSVGAALVDAGIHRPEALERSLVFLDEHLLVETRLGRLHLPAAHDPSPGGTRRRVGERAEGPGRPVSA